MNNYTQMNNRLNVLTAGNYLPRAAICNSIPLSTKLRNEINLNAHSKNVVKNIYITAASESISRRSMRSIILHQRLLQLQEVIKRNQMKMKKIYNRWKLLGRRMKMGKQLEIIVTKIPILTIAKMIHAVRAIF